MKMEVVRNMSARRLASESFAPRRNQKGAAALEYLVLAAALVLLLGGALSTDLQSTINGAFTGIFESAASGAE